MALQFGPDVTERFCRKNNLGGGLKLITYNIMFRLSIICTIIVYACIAWVYYNDVHVHEDLLCRNLSLLIIIIDNVLHGYLIL